MKRNNIIPKKFIKRYYLLSSEKRKLLLTQFINIKHNSIQMPSFPPKDFLEKILLSYNQLFLSFMNLFVSFPNEVIICDFYGHTSIENLQLALTSTIQNNDVFHYEYKKFTYGMRKNISNINMKNLDFTKCEDTKKNLKTLELIKGLTNNKNKSFPYFKIIGINLDKYHYKLLIAFSHQIIDRQSKYNFIEQLIYHYKEYNGVLQQRIPPVVPYSKFIVYEQHFFGAHSQPIIQAINQQLQVANLISFPMKYCKETAPVVNENIVISVKLFNELKIFSGKKQMYLEEVILAALVFSLQKYTIKPITHIILFASGDTEYLQSIIGPRVQERLISFPAEIQSLRDTITTLHEAYVNNSINKNYPLGMASGRLCLKLIKNRFIYFIVRYIAKLLNKILISRPFGQEIIEAYFGLMYYKFLNVIKKKCSMLLAYFPSIQNQHSLLMVNFTHRISKNFDLSTAQNSIDKMVLSDYPPLPTSKTEYMCLNVNKTEIGTIKYNLNSFLSNDINKDILNNMLIAFKEIASRDFDSF